VHRDKAGRPARRNPGGILTDKGRSTAHASTTTSMAADDDLAGLRARLLSADPAADGDGAGQAVAGIQAGEARVGRGVCKFDATWPDSPAGLSFERDVRRMFREKDRDSMFKAFDLWSHSDVQEHQDAILERLRNRTMPCDGYGRRSTSPSSSAGSPAVGALGAPRGD